MSGGDSATPNASQPNVSQPQMVTPSQSYTDLLNWDVSNAPAINSNNLTFQTGEAQNQNKITGITGQGSLQNYIDALTGNGANLLNEQYALARNASPTTQLNQSTIQGYLSNPTTIPGGQAASDYQSIFASTPAASGDLLAALNKRAIGDLSLGSSMDRTTVNQLEQETRGTWSDRGLAESPAAAENEMFTTGIEGQKLYQQRLNEAMGVQALNDQLGSQAILAAGGVNEAQQSQFRDLTALLGMSMPLSPNATASDFGEAFRPSMTQDLFSPVNQANWTGLQGEVNSANAQMYDANLASQTSMYNAQLGLEGSTYQSDWNKMMSGIKTASSVAAMAMACWVAREVYGKANPKWIQFRQWLTATAPKWFLNLYLTYGEQIADWIKDKPLIKSRIRGWMDTQIETLA